MSLQENFAPLNFHQGISEGEVSVLNLNHGQQQPQNEPHHLTPQLEAHAPQPSPQLDTQQQITQPVVKLENYNNFGSIEEKVDLTKLTPDNAALLPDIKIKSGTEDVSVVQDTSTEYKSSAVLDKVRIQNLESSSYQGKIIIQIIQELQELKECLDDGINMLNHQVGDYIQTCVTHFNTAKSKGLDIQQILFSHCTLFEVVEMGVDGVKKVDSNDIKVEPEFSLEMENDYSQENFEETLLSDNEAWTKTEDFDIGEYEDETWSKPAKTKVRKTTKSTSTKKNKNKANHNEKILQTRSCKHCNLQFKGRTRLLDHINQEHSELRPYKCDQCDKSYAKQKHLTEHLVTHTGVKPFECECGAAFPTKTRLEDHRLKMHTSERPHKCDVCGKGYVYLRELTNHMKTHEEKPTFSCDQCGKTFNQEHLLETHMKKFVEGICQGEHPHVCKECGKRFKKRGHMKEHMAIHFDARPHQCPHCDKAFKIKGALNHHVKTHQAEEDRPFKCEMCGRGCISIHLLKIHMRHHTGEKPYHCDQCSKRFCTKGEINKHMLTHSSVRPFKCDQCFRDFTDKKALRNHMRVHAPEKPFKCEVCDKGYTTREGLNIHNRHHTGERPFKCDQCGEGFVQKKQLQYHTLIHTGERPFKCTICGEGFRDSSTMKQHRDRHKGNGDVARKVKINKTDQNLDVSSNNLYLGLPARYLNNQILHTHTSP